MANSVKVFDLQKAKFSASYFKTLGIYCKDRYSWTPGRSYLNLELELVGVSLSWSAGRIFCGAPPFTSYFKHVCLSLFLPPHEIFPACSCADLSSPWHLPLHTLCFLTTMPRWQCSWSRTSSHCFFRYRFSASAAAATCLILSVFL